MRIFMRTTFVTILLLAICWPGRSQSTEPGSARPGHKLQFDGMVERGVSAARALYAFNSTNVEGWGLYSEYLIEPYMPLEGRLISLQFRLLRAAPAFLDPELQTGRLRPEDAMRILTHDVVLSEPFANSELERYMYWDPGGAPCGTASQNYSN